MVEDQAHAGTWSFDSIDVVVQINLRRLCYIILRIEELAYSLLDWGWKYIISVVRMELV